MLERRIFIALSLIIIDDASIVKLAFISHKDLMDLRCVTFKSHKAFEREFRTFIAGNGQLCPGWN